MKTFEKEVICQICGFRHSRTLQGHIKKQHKDISVKEYKKLYNAEIVTEELKRDRSKKCSKPRGPMSEEEKRKRSLANKKFWEQNVEKRQEVSERMKQLAEEGRHNFQKDEVKKRNSERLVELNKSEEHRKIVSDRFLGKERPEEHVRKSAEGHIGYKHTEEAKMKMSKSQKASFASGKRKEPGKYLGKIWSNKNNKYIYYRSELELLYIHELERIENVTKYDCGFGIPYKLNNEQYTYFPDFIINNDTIVEINSRNVFYINRDKKEAKVEATREFCKENGYEYRILYEDYFGVEYNTNEEVLNYDFPTC